MAKTQTSVEKLSVALVGGQIPRKKCIIKDGTDLKDMKAVEAQMTDFLLDRVEIQYGFGLGINQVPSEASKDLVYIYNGNRALEVYVNAPTQVVALLIKLCAVNGVKLKLYYQDLRTGKWDIIQEIF